MTATIIKAFRCSNALKTKTKDKNTEENCNFNIRN